MERGKKELFFVQNILFFVQKIKKRPDKFEETRARIKKTCPRFETLAGMFLQNAGIQRMTLVIYLFSFLAY